MHTHDIIHYKNTEFHKKNQLKLAQNKQKHPIILEKSMKSQQNHQKVAQTSKKQTQKPRKFDKSVKKSRKKNIINNEPSPCQWRNLW